MQKSEMSKKDVEDIKKFIKLLSKNDQRRIISKAISAMSDDEQTRLLKDIITDKTIIVCPIMMVAEQIVSNRNIELGPDFIAAIDTEFHRISFAPEPMDISAVYYACLSTGGEPEKVDWNGISLQDKYADAMIRISDPHANTRRKSPWNG